MSLGLLNWWGYLDDSDNSWVKGFFIPFTAIEEWETAIDKINQEENRVVGKGVNPAWDKGREWITNHGPSDSYPEYQSVKSLEIYPLLSEERIFLPLDYLLPKDGVIGAESLYMSSLDHQSRYPKHAQYPIMACFERLGGRSLQKLKKIWGSTLESLQLALDKWDDLNHSPALVLFGPEDAKHKMAWREWLSVTRMTEEEFQSAFYYWEDEDWWICIDSDINKAVQQWLQQLYSPSMLKGSIMADFNHIQYLAGCDMTQNP